MPHWESHRTEPLTPHHPVAFGIDRARPSNTARRKLRDEGTSGVYTVSAPRAQPANDKIRVQVASILEEEKRSAAPKKQWLTTATIHRLLGADGAKVSLRPVQMVVTEDDSKFSL